MFFRVGVQLIEEKYCCDCLFLFVLFCEFVKQDWDLTKKGGKCGKNSVTIFIFQYL